MEIVEDEGAWVASIPDLPGCNSYGETINQAVENLQRTKNLWIEGQYKADLHIPEPTDEDDFSGKFVLRIPKTLHRSLAHEATKQGVSLNHYASHLLSRGESLSVINSLLHTRQSLWVQYHEKGSYKYVTAGGQLPGNVAYVAQLRVPASKYKFKAPEVSDPINEQYRLK